MNRFAESMERNPKTECLRGHLKFKIRKLCCPIQLLCWIRIELSKNNFRREHYKRKD